jgi:aminoglycoside/choline kinase family phosphotransferase
MRDRLTAESRPATGEVRVMYLWPLAIVLRAPTASGPCFLKCAARTFPHEAAITAALAGRTPWGVPEVIAVEPAQNWLLMGDLGEDALGAKPADAWADGAARLAELQRAWVGSTDALLAAGALRRTPAALADDVPGLLDVGGLGGRLRSDIRADWATAVPRLVEACHRLAELPIPETLVHGDFHPWNVVRTPDGLVVFDWSDGAVGHPFVDLATTLIRTPDLAIRRAIADRYLEAWPELPAAERGPATDLALVVGSLYQVQSYLGIFATLDPFESLDLIGADEQWVGRSLDALERGIAFRRRRE